MALRLRGDKDSKQKSFQDRRNASVRRGRHVIFFLLLFLIYQLTTTFFVKSYYLPNRGMEPTLPMGSRILASPLFYGPTLWGGHRLASSTTPKRGDIVLTQSPGNNEIGRLNYFLKPFSTFFSFQFINGQGKKGKLKLPDLLVKRVIALPGDTIKMENSVIFVKPAGQLYFISEFEYGLASYEVKRQASTELIEQSLPFSNSFNETTLRDNEFFVIGDNRSLTNDSRSFGYINQRDIRAKVIGRYWPIK